MVCPAVSCRFTATLRASKGRPPTNNGTDDHEQSRKESSWLPNRFSHSRISLSDGCFLMSLAINSFNPEHGLLSNPMKMGLDKTPTIAGREAKKADFDKAFTSISNTRGKPLAIIDYLTVVIPQDEFLLLDANGAGISSDGFITLIESTLIKPLGLYLSGKEKGGRNFYAKRYEIQQMDTGDVVGWVMHGGATQKKTICIELQGKACAIAGPKISHLYNWMNYYFVPSYRGMTRGHITRIDIAHDCYNGEHNIKEALLYRETGQFVSEKRGHPPKSKLIDDFDSGEGKTLYVGKRENGKMMRVYEKGMQLKDEGSPWVRWELQLNRRDRDIPLDSIVNPAPYLAGAYICMAWLEIEQCHIKTKVKEAKISLSHLVKHCGIAYGRLINVLTTIYDDPQQIIEQLIVPDGIPRRLERASITM